MGFASVGFPLLQSGLSTLTGLWNNNQNFSRQKALLNEQNAFALSQWNRANAYNSPQNQKKMMVEAGYNPNFMDGSSFVDASPVEPSQVPQVQQSSPGDFSSLSSIVQNGLLREQLRGVRLENDEKEEDLKAKREEFGLDEIQGIEDAVNFFANSSFKLAKDGSIDKGFVYNGVTVKPKYDFWRMNRLKQKQDLLHGDIINKQAGMALNAIVDDYPFMRYITKENLEKLRADVRINGIKGDVLQRDYDFYKEYGIPPDASDGLTNFLRAALVNPHAYSNMLNSFIKAIGEEFKTLGDWMRSMKPDWLKRAGKFFSGD